MRRVGAVTHSTARRVTLAALGCGVRVTATVGRAGGSIGGSCMLAAAAALCVSQLGRILGAFLALLLQHTAGSFDARVNLGALLRPDLLKLERGGVAGNQVCGSASTCLGKSGWQAGS